MPEQPKIQFTPAQAAAISARGGSLLVSAAAGSGKTRVLVERVVGLITDPVHPVDANQLLIMTFTNAAAAKLRADITTRLAQEVRAHPGDLHLRSQQLLLQRASIGTVDAFCLHFVQQHFAMLDVPPDFETADEADLARIEQETLAATLETAYQDPDFRAFADLYDRGRTDNTAGTRSSTSTTLPARCPTRRHRWRPLPQCGSRTPRRRIRSGAKNCWALRWPAHRVPKRCWKAAQPLRPATRLQTGPTPPSCRTTPRG